MLNKEEHKKLEKFLKKIVELNEKSQNALKALGYYKPINKKEKETLEFIQKSFQGYIVYFSMIVEKAQEKTKEIVANTEETNTFSEFYEQGDIDIINTIDKEFQDLNQILVELNHKA